MWKGKRRSEFDKYPMTSPIDEEGQSKRPLMKKDGKSMHNLFEGSKMRSRESLDYRLADNEPLREFYATHMEQKKFKPKLVMIKWIIYFLIGIFLGLLTFLIKWGVKELQEVKHMAFDYFMEKGNYIGAFLCITQLILPLAGGSGIPEVKGYLNGVKVDGTINLKTFLGKVLSIIPAYSSCLALGPEGPMVHIGSMIGAGLSATKSRTLRIRIPGPQYFERLRTDREQRDFISSGIAAGIAAAFGSPIGGVLFALEEASSFWTRELTWRTFFGCMVSALTTNVLLQFIRNADEKSYANGGLLTFGLSRLYSYRYPELLAFSFLGVIGGLLGALFVKLNMKINIWRRSKIQTKLLKIAEVFVVVSIFACISFLIPSVTPCSPIKDIQYLNTSLQICDVIELNETALSSTFCSKGEYSDFANLFLSPQDEVIKMLFSRTKDIFTFQSMIVFLIIYFAMVTVTAGLSVAAGLFVPMMLVGAVYGRIVGKALLTWFPHLSPPIDPSIYALVGCAAMMSGFSRTTISLCVIIMELTESTQFLLPLMLAIMCAKWVGDAFGKSIYEEMMELKSITFIEHHPPVSTYSLTVRDVMAKEVVCINEIDSVKRIVEILETTNHNGFPVVSVRDQANDGQEYFKGFVTRKQLLILLDSKKYQKKESADQPPLIIDFEKYITQINYKWSLEKVTLPARGEMENLVINVAPYMDKSHPIALDSWSYIDAYRFFQIQGLRHLTVLDEELRVVGIITRHDLLFFHNSDHEEDIWT